MQISEEILKQLNMQSEDTVVKIDNVEETIEFLKKCANKIVEKSELYQKSNNNDEKEDLLDILSNRLNSFAQAFRDLVIFLLKKENIKVMDDPALNYTIKKYDFIVDDTKQTPKEKQFLEGLGSRNDIIHDYFDVMDNIKKIEIMIYNYADGSLDVCHSLEQYCIDKGYMDETLTRRDKT